MWSSRNWRRDSGRVELHEQQRLMDQIILGRCQATPIARDNRR
jgi:hypothetical protein